MYDRILVAYDGSDGAGRALQEALGLARNHNARLLLVHVLDESVFYRYPAPGIDISPLIEAWQRSGENLVRDAVSRVEKEGVTVEGHVLETQGRPISEVLLEQVKTRAADLVVMGTHGRHGVQHLFLGSVAEGVIRHVDVPVLVVRAS